MRKEAENKDNIKNTSSEETAKMKNYAQLNREEFKSELKEAIAKVPFSYGPEWPYFPSLEVLLSKDDKPEERTEYQRQIDEVIGIAKQLLRTYASYIDDPENYDFSRLIYAVEFAFKAHLKQKRASGDPYIIHPLEVAMNLTELEVDEDTIIAACLHDTVEDTEVTLQDITENFGETVSSLVDGVTKLEKFTYSSKEDLQAENFRKMFLAMAQDIRVVLIKLADRMHNMRTMEYMPARKQERISRETMDIYAPLAGRLGIYRWKMELEDLSFKYLDPTAYFELAGAIKQKQSERNNYLQVVIEDILKKLSAAGINCSIDGRTKHLYSIYRKMKTKHKHLNEIYDLFACRVIVSTVTDCYSVFGIVHDMFRPMPGRFKDYIATPKANGYQSLHTTVVGPNGFPFEIQIRTEEMHELAEYGVAAHWRYKAKQGGAKLSKKANKEDEKLSWLRQLLDWQKDMKNSTDYMEELREGLIEEEVYVFTPNGDVVALPQGSCPIDFAYMIHSGVGNHMYGARVNDQMTPIDYKLQNGDIVEILTSERIKGPSLDWLKIVKSNSARNKINYWFKQERKAESIERGRDEVEKEIRKNGFVSLQLLRTEYLEPLLRRYGFNSVDDMYAAIGQNSKNGVSAKKIVPKLRDEYIKNLSEEKRQELGYRIGDNGQVIYSPVDPILQKAKDNAEKGIGDRVAVESSKPNKYGIIVEGIDNVLMSLANCCNPVPGDDIVGYITRGKGVTVHRVDCNNMKNLVAIKRDKYEGEPDKKMLEEAGRLIKVYWDKAASKGVFQVPILIKARDRSSLLVDVSNAISDEKVAIISGQMNSVKDMTANLHLIIEVNSQEQYDRLIGRIKAIRDVVDVRRDDL